MEIRATFYVGFSGGRWERAGPFVGRGGDVQRASSDAMARCALEFSDQNVLFMTFASVEHLGQQATSDILIF